ncbi:hypothetical protein JM93_00502 [Roseibium hamelinense]|uniref:Uncharacterized protein n=1 Tax=Roseibium hamelinense TaxID=150831 RepID=A0A562TJK1_9HYPH|nr:hypothetical protein JM93_00502 [Roseibium hamelinense]
MQLDGETTANRNHTRRVNAFRGDFAAHRILEAGARCKRDFQQRCPPVRFGSGGQLKQVSGAGAVTTGRTPLLSVVAQLRRFATKHGIGQDRVANDHRQHEQRAQQNDEQAFGRAGAFVQRKLFRHDIRIE